MGEEFPNGRHTVTPPGIVNGHTGILNGHRIKDKEDGEHWCGISLVRKRNKERKMPKSNFVEVKFMIFLYIKRN